MFASMYERLENIAKEDNDREDRLGGASCPIKLDLWLVGGHELRDVALVDGLNSLDDETIDVKLHRAAPTHPDTWTVAIAHIAMLRHVWPTEADEEAAVRTREALAADAGMTASGGTFGTYLGRLRSRGMLHEQGKRISLNPALMEWQ